MQILTRQSVITNVITLLPKAENDMVALKLRKVGNSLGVVLPKEVLGHLRAAEGEELYLLEGPNNSYRLTALDPSFQSKMEKAEEIMGRYRNTLNVLSK
jgi:putative addiction module antidote